MHIRTYSLHTYYLRFEHEMEDFLVNDLRD